MATLHYYAPEKVRCNGMIVPVTQYIVHPPGNHPKNCPLVDHVTALEMVTPKGSRWSDCERGYINSELRMVVVADFGRDEVRSSWEKVPSDRAN
jgi:hypothetical protein